jgi:hypothetical protein
MRNLPVVLPTRTKRVLEHGNPRRLLPHLHRSDVETARSLAEAMTRDVVLRHRGKASLFLPSDCIRGIAKTAIQPGLHFDEHDPPAVTRDDVDFAKAGAITPRHEGISTPFELAAHEFFTMDTKRLSGESHAQLVATHMPVRRRARLSVASPLRGSMGGPSAPV